MMQEKIINPFLQINANYVAEQFETPLFIMAEQGIIQRFHALHNAVKKRYSHSIIAISYKTNFLKGLLALLHHEGAHAEVVSGIEYAVAKEVRLAQQKIIFNGLMKTDDELTQAINDGAIINCDHEDEIVQIEQIAKNRHIRVPIGIRIYFSDSKFSWNRFGFEVQNNLSNPFTLALIKRIIASPHLKLAGLHTHIGTNI